MQEKEVSIFIWGNCGGDKKSMRYENIGKIKWHYVGKYRRPLQKVFGKLKKVRCCPICDEKELDFYKSHKRFKLKCQRCSYEKIDDKLERNSIEFDSYELLKQF